MYGSNFCSHIRGLGGSEMSVKNATIGKSIFDSLVEDYGLNKVLSVFASTAGLALVGFVLSANLTPSKPTVIIVEKENER